MKMMRSMMAFLLASALVASEVTAWPQLFGGVDKNDYTLKGLIARKEAAYEKLQQILEELSDNYDYQFGEELGSKKALNDFLNQ